MNTLNEFFTSHGDVVFGGICLYLALISLVSVAVTIADKNGTENKLFSKKQGHRRVPEATLLLYAAFGGSAAMLITMLLVRHKTRHIKFMLGIPLILVFQTVVAVWLSVNVL